MAELVDRCRGVGHRALAGAEHVDEVVDLADVGEKLVAEALALGGAAHESGDVDELQHRRNRLCGLGDRRQLVEARVGHRHAPDVGLDGARSEEHTSELQSLMRISYAVFCLKKKQTHKNNNVQNNNN